MTGDNKTPPQQWPAPEGTLPPASAGPEPVTRRKSRSEAATPTLQPAAPQVPATPLEGTPPAEVRFAPPAAPAPAASTATPPPAKTRAPKAAPAEENPALPAASSATPAPRLPEFGNGNIFGEAFATLLDQVEAAKQHEREEEERAAQAALARALSEKLGSATRLQPATEGAPPPAPTFAAPLSAPEPTPATDFASRARAYAQTAPSTAPAPSTTPAPSASSAQNSGVVYPASAPSSYSYGADSTQVYSASPHTQPPPEPAVFAAQPAAPLPAQPVAELHYPAPASHTAASVPVVVTETFITDVSNAAQEEVPPEILAQTPSLPSEPLHQQPLPNLSYAMPSQVTHLKPRFASSGPFLARFLPDVPSSHTGIQAGFCNLHDFLGFLHEQNWYGYLHAALGEQAAYVLVYEGRTVAAACLSSTGEQALGELLHLYEQGAHLSAYPLDDYLAHILSGVGSRAWKFNLTEDFTGLHAKPDEAAYYYQGRVVATMPAGLPYEGAFPAPLRPQTLVLPRSLAGWAHHSYTATLRGRDAINAITPAHQMFKAKFGAAGLTLQAALLEGLTPAEYALRHDTALHELEPVVHELVQLGYLKDE